MEDINLLKQIPLFSEFKAVELMNVSMVAERKRFAAGETIVQERAKGDSLCVIKSGRVKVCKADSSGEDHLLAFLEPGEYFGEISLLDRAPRSASVYADTDAEILVIKAADFHNLIAANKEIERKFYKSFSKVLCERLRITNENLTFSQEINKMIRQIEEEK
jgi:CRP-like cAMP-binding protein